MKKERIAGVLLSLVAVISLTGCGSSSDGVKTESSIDYNGNGDLYYEDDMYDGGEWTESERENSASVADNRKLIKTVDLTAETYEFDSLVTTVEQRVTSLGGYMESASIHTRYDDLKYGDFIIRIPVNKMEEFVTEFAEISNITDRSSTQKDVTLSYVDLESHKAALEAEEASLLKLLENAMSIDDIIALQSRLSEVRYQIESMESQLRTMDNLVDYATINLYIEEVEDYTPIEQPGMGERISKGFKQSIEQITKDAKNLIIFVIVNSPYLVIWGVIIAVTLIVLRLIIKAAIKKGDAKAAKQMQQNIQQNIQQNGK